MKRIYGLIFALMPAIAFEGALAFSGRTDRNKNSGDNFTIVNSGRWSSLRNKYLPEPEPINLDFSGPFDAVGVLFNLYETNSIDIKPF